MDEPQPTADEPQPTADAPQPLGQLEAAEGSQATADPDAWGGAPLRSNLKLLLIPGLVVGLVTMLGLGLPTWLLYGVGGIFGVVLLRRAWHDPEPLLAAATVYLPLSKIYVIPLGPGLNGTNILFVLLIISAFRASRGAFDRAPDGEGAAPAPAAADPPRSPTTGLMRSYAIWTLLSVPVALFVAGFEFVTDHLDDLKLWIDQFVVFFTFMRLIRDGKMARRMMVYVMLAATIVLALGFQEWLEKRDAGSIEKARLLGPQLQPNDFGGYVSFAAAPFIALLLNNLLKPRILAFTVPYLLVTARILLATFSRGAYLGMALGGIVAGYIRGKFFLIGAAVAGLLLVIAVPQIVPESLQARMAQTSDTSGGTEKLDTSAQTRLILWDAALKITKRSPIFGYGFKTFPKFKAEFTEQEVHESDNHNMYLYLSSQMGIPAVVLLLLIMWRMGSLGYQVYRRTEDKFSRVVGMSATTLAATAFLVNMFGSRMVDICVSVNFWITLAIISRLWMDVEARRMAEQPQS